MLKQKPLAAAVSMALLAAPGAPALAQDDDGTTHGCTHGCTGSCPDTGNCTYGCTYGCTNGCGTDASAVPVREDPTHG